MFTAVYAEARIFMDRHWQVLHQEDELCERPIDPARPEHWCCMRRWNHRGRHVFFSQTKHGKVAAVWTSPTPT